ncbi:ABC transporter ATP-binding protein [Desulfocicer vacuolatum]|nr:ABC transporter ATP-binding protein [Desulfocicer vacuolatum]
MKIKPIVSCINFSVPKGRITGLVGPNGAGKTTTLKLGAGLIKPQSGEVLIRNIPAHQKKARSLTGFLTENQYAYPHLRLKEWLQMMAELSGIKSKKAAYRTLEILELVELRSLKNQLMQTLSKGQLQRAGLAQALIHSPAILLLDEPMSGLDPYWRLRVQQILLDFKKNGGTILFSSHILSDVERLCDSLVLIKNGQISWKGEISALSRKIKFYEAVVSKINDQKLIQNISNSEIELRHDGTWMISFPVDKKNKIIELASKNIISLISLKPIQENIEEMLLYSITDVKKAS